jgi:hypothetical protein
VLAVMFCISVVSTAGRPSVMFLQVLSMWAVMVSSMRFVLSAGNDITECRTNRRLFSTVEMVLLCVAVLLLQHLVFSKVCMAMLWPHRTWLVMV